MGSLSSKKSSILSPFTLSCLSLMISGSLNAGTPYANNSVSTPHQLRENATKNFAGIVKEFEKAKTVGAWVNMGNKETKLFRRTYFSKNSSWKLPSVIQKSNRLLVYTRGQKHPPDVMLAKSVNGQIHYFYNNRDITRTKGESLEKWGKRLFPALTKSVGEKHRQSKSSFAWISLFITKASAAEGEDFDFNIWLADDLKPFSVYQTSFFQALMASMTVDDFNELNVRMDPRVGSLGEYGKNLHAQFGLECVADGSQAFFNFDHINVSGGKPFRIKSAFNSETNRTNMSIFDQEKDSVKEFVRVAYNVNTNIKDFEWANEVGESCLWDPKNGNTNYPEGVRSKSFLDSLENAFRTRPDAYVNDAFYQNNDFETEMQALRILSDIAITCCNNKYCKEYVNPTILPRQHQESSQ